MNELTFKIVGPISGTGGISVPSDAQGAVMVTWLPPINNGSVRKEEKYEAINHVSCKVKMYLP